LWIDGQACTDPEYWREDNIAPSTFAASRSKMPDTQKIQITAALELHFPAFEPALREHLAEIGTIHQLSAGSTLMQRGQNIRSAMLIVDGRVKLYRESEDEVGEFFIYQLHPGNACALSMVCGGRHSTSEVKGVATEDTVIVKIPIDKMEELVTRHPGWYQFVIETYRQRFEELIQTLDAIAFKSMDQRLYSYLESQTRSYSSGMLPLSHQQIATDLNSSREVISRLLKKLEQKNIVKLSRNYVEWLGDK
jgi:CRP/FNR family transcriptional regulator